MRVLEGIAWHKNQLKNPFAMRYGTISQSKPFIKKKKKPAQPIRLSHVLKLLGFSSESICQ